MGIFHFRGELVERDAESARYRFQTSYLDAPGRIGVLRVNLATWAWAIEQSADSGCYADGTSIDAHCAAALIHKVRKASDEGELPEIVFHTA